MSDLSEALRLFITNTGSRARLDVGGELDLATVEAFRDHLEVLVESATGDVDVDMALVTFCDVTMLPVLVGARHQLASVGRRLRIVNASRSVGRLLELTGLSSMLLDQAGEPDTAIDVWSPDPKATPTTHQRGACTSEEGHSHADRQARERHRG